MTFAILIVFLAIALAVDWQLERKKNSRRVALAGQMSVQGAPKLVGIPAADRAAIFRKVLPALAAREVYHHPGHAWARWTDDDLISVGANEISGKLMGALDLLELPPVGAHLRQGRPAWKMGRKGRFVEQLSPLSGEVVEVNQAALTRPELVNDAPYRRGWLLKIRPSGLADELENLFAGSLADAWLTLSKERINAAFGPPDSELLATAQDGGELIDGIGDQLSDAQWKTLSRQLFGGR